MFRFRTGRLVFPVLAWLVCCCSVQAATYNLGENFEEVCDAGKCTRTIHSAPIAFHDGAKFVRINPDWADGDTEFPNVVTAAKLRLKTAPDGMRRIYPIPGDDTKWMEIGAPIVKNASGVWFKPTFSSITRTANKLVCSNAQAIMTITHAGHFIKLDIELLGGWVPRDGQFAFPVGLQGLTRNGSRIMDGETVVSVLRPPVVYDAANPGDVRPIASEFFNVSGQAYIRFTLPDLTGMSRPVVDPTLTQEGDAADGYVSGLHAAYATARSTSSASNIVGTSLSIGQDISDYFVARSFLKFDTSLIPDSTIVSQVNLIFTINTNSSTTDFDVQIVKQDWSAQDPIGAASRESAYDGCLAGTADVNIWRNTSGIATNTSYTSGNLNTLWVSKTGNTYYSLRSSRDFDNTTPTNSELITIHSTNSATEAYRPKLVIVYSIPPILRPIIISQSRIMDWWNGFEGRFVR